MSDTKLTSATIRIALSHNYSTFEISSTLENQNGITTKEIEDCRQTCQALVADAVNDYKRMPNTPIKDQIKEIENKIEKVKAVISEKIEPEEVTDPKEIAEIEKLPLYGETKSKKTVKKT